MLKSLIVKALLIPAIGGPAYLAGGGDIPTLPTTDTTPPAAAPALAAPQPVGGFEIIATCDDPQDAPRATQGPAQARKAEQHRVTVRVPQAPAQAPAQAPPARSQAPAPTPTREAPAATSTAQPTAAASPSTSTDGKLNVNDPANDAALLALPGLGDGALSAIRDARPIATVDDVGKLPGVTPANFAKYKGRITV